MITIHPPSCKSIHDAMRVRRYVVFDSARGYDLNLIGVRTKDEKSNRFNDWFCVMYLQHGKWSFFAFPATTDPGVYWRQNPMNRDGTAILVPGQYIGAYRIGEHKGYGALAQKEPLKVYRDSNKDEILDMDPSKIQEGKFGINIHRSGAKTVSSKVERWSAGCQVVADPIQFEVLMMLARKSASIYGNSFTYTLLTEDDLNHRS